MRFYLSHPIRGEKGDKATSAEIVENNRAAKVVADYIRGNITPKIDVHVPAEMETFVHLAYRMKVLNEKQILDVDCKIIDGCDAVLVYAPFGNVVSGCKVELDYAIEHHKPVFIFEDAFTAVNMIAEFILRG